MKKLLVPIVALLSFSVLCTSVSAGMPYVIRFHGQAFGNCRVHYEVEANGATRLKGVLEINAKGRLHVRGLAIGTPVYDDAVPYGLRVDLDDGWYHADAEGFLKFRGWLRVSWDDMILMVYMQMHEDMDVNTYGNFFDESDEFYIGQLMYSGWYKEGGAPPQYIGGEASVEFYYTGFCYWSAEVRLDWFREGGDILVVEWDGDGPLDIAARGFNHRVTVWPIFNGIV